MANRSPIKTIYANIDPSMPHQMNVDNPLKSSEYTVFKKSDEQLLST